MTQLSKAAFLAKWLTLFADNTSREISEKDMRDFRQDIADSFWNQVDDALTALDKLQVDTSGASITLDMESKSNRLFYGSASWATAKTLAVSNATNAVSFVFLFEITNTAGTLELPSNFM